MTEARLRALVAVAETGSVRGAAARLVITESAVSAAVSALSRDLGVPLLAREGRGLRLTAAGASYLSYARRVLGLLEEGRAAARGEVEPGRGRLRLAAVTTAGEQLLPAAIASFHRRWPEVELALEVCPSDRVWQLLTMYEVDLVLAGRPPTGVEATVLATRANELIAVASLEVAGRFRIATTPWLLREPGSGTRATVEAYLAEHQADPPLLVLGSTGAVVAGAISGLGVALVSRDGVRAQLADQTLVPVPAPGMPLLRPWHAVAGATPTRTTRLLVDHLLDDTRRPRWRRVRPSAPRP